MNSLINSLLSRERETHLVCICLSITEIPFVTDSTLEQLFLKKQLLCLYVTSFDGDPNYEVDNVLKEIQADQVKGKKSKCRYLNEVADFRMFKYSGDHNSSGKPPQLVERHNVGYGSFMVRSLVNYFTANTSASMF